MTTTTTSSTPRSNKPATSYVLLLIAIAVSATLTTVNFASMSTTTIYAQDSVPATQSSKSTPPQPKDQPDVAQQFTFNALSKPPNNIEQCMQYGKELVGKAIPDHNLCDLVVYRQAPAITRIDGMVLNNFSGMGHYIEMIPAGKVLNNTQPFAGDKQQQASNATGNNNTNTVVAFGEFALLDSEVVPVHKIIDKYNWTLTTIHNHMIDESPKLLFLHWTVTGNPNDIVKEAKEMIMATSTYSDEVINAARSGNATRGVPSSAGP